MVLRREMGTLFTSMSDPLIIIGASARAAAQSAIRAGYAPWCIDLFADIDLQAIAPVKRCPREKWPQGVLELMEDAPQGPVLFTGGMENHIDVVRAIEAKRPLFTGPASVIAQLRSPRAAHHALIDSLARSSETLRWRDGITDAPAVQWDDDLAACSPHKWRGILAGATAHGERYLVKPRRGAGGRGIRFWWPGDDIAESEYVQHFRSGRSLSAVFIASGRQIAMLTIAEQIIGNDAFGAPGLFAYTGNILPAAVTDSEHRQFAAAGRAIAEWSGITGIFGIDAVIPSDHDRSYPLNDGRIHIVDINPRYPASAELFERGDEQCAVLDANRLFAPRGRFNGKATVFARAACRTSGELFAHDAARLADIPEPGERIEAGRPVCTVFAEGATRDACYAGLREMAEKVYTRLQPA
jgi:predicted ATP-grasp superfamily ATP-dependent carboligase